MPSELKVYPETTARQRITFVTTCNLLRRAVSRFGDDQRYWKESANQYRDVDRLNYYQIMLQSGMTEKVIGNYKGTAVKEGDPGPAALREHCVSAIKPQENV